VLVEQFNMPRTQIWLLFFGIFLVIGIVLSVLLRLAITEMVGARISAPDRLAGALLGAVRICLLAVLMVLIFDRIIPFDRQPAFLTGSQVRPILSKAGQAGVKTLPKDATDFIDQLKRARGL
jgi:membrane protein required for colicin V production